MFAARLIKSAARHYSEGVNTSTAPRTAISVHLPAAGNHEFFLIHGYTGSPTDFNGLERVLHQEFAATVKIIAMKGHGTHIEHLDGLHYRDFFEQVETELKRDLDSGKTIILGGMSFGGQLALSLAARYPVAGVFTIAVPYRLKFPFSIPGLPTIGIWKKYWPKHMGLAERMMREREHAVYYTRMPISGLKIVRRANRDLRRRLGRIHCPCLTIYSTKDPVGHYKCVATIENSISSPVKESVISNNQIHNLFFSTDRALVTQKIVDFCRRHAVFHRTNTAGRETVTAIVPAYNEEARLGSVLQALTATALLDEIIVVDDGSTDNTAAVVKQFPSVRYLRNARNRGKSYAMDRGVRATSASIIFFCDADLTGLTPAIIESIIRPVLAGEAGMSIGIRNNLMQKSLLSVALNSGERAIRRQTWEQLPQFYKYRYRIEIGLNNFLRRHDQHIHHAVYPYYQTIKEAKYGFRQGMVLRWRMNYDVVLAFLYAHTLDRLRRRKQRYVQRRTLKHQQTLAA